jgi:hypothetical protein
MVRNFEDWFRTLDIHKIDPFTEVDSEHQIEVFLRLAWEEGYERGYSRGVWDEVEGQVDYDTLVGEP